MDTSETYIKMCEKAVEIQEDHKYWAEGDFGYWPPSDDINVMYSGEYTPDELGEGPLWLPRQDQLQEILEGDAISLIQRFWGWIITDNYVPIGLPQPSMEQLWLAFVMSSRYVKAWDGEDWVNDG